MLRRQRLRVAAHACRRYHHHEQRFASVDTAAGRRTWALSTAALSPIHLTLGSLVVLVFPLALFVPSQSSPPRPSPLSSSRFVTGHHSPLPLTRFPPSIQSVSMGCGASDARGSFAVASTQSPALARQSGPGLAPLPPAKLPSFALIEARKAREKAGTLKYHAFLSHRRSDVKVSARQDRTDRSE